jgi:SAM-dependent methyltransferase
MINAITTTQRFARPYSRLAPVYDSALGISNFFGIRTAFETLVRRYGIRFRSAADIGCGTGLFAGYLNRNWSVPVFGVDRSPEMLQVAVQNCPDRRVCFMLQDIRCLRLPYRVDLITANFDTMNHLLNGLELRSAFRRIWENLRPGGYLVFDLITPCQPLAGGVIQIRRLSSGRCNAVQRIRWDPVQKILSIVVIIRAPFSSGSTLEAHRERAYSPVEVGRWLMDAGFIIRGIHDAATLRITTACPPRIIVIAQKRPLPLLN